MAWKVVVGAEEGAWPDPAQVPLDAASGWVEAWDGIIPDYTARQFDDEADANAVARRLRSYGFITATEPEEENP